MMHFLKTKGSFEYIGLTPDRLRRRLAYLTSRYNKDCQYSWQFVIWLRLFLLTCCTLVPDAVSRINRNTAGGTELSESDIEAEEASEVRGGSSRSASTLTLTLTPPTSCVAMLLGIHTPPLRTLSPSPL